MQNELAEYKVPTGIVDLSPVSHMLVEQMKEVKQNPAAIPQAHSMAEIAHRICEIAKVQVQQGEMVIEFLRAKNSEKV